MLVLFEVVLFFVVLEFVVELLLFDEVLFDVVVLVDFTQLVQFELHSYQDLHQHASASSSYTE